MTEQDHELTVESELADSTNSDEKGYVRKPHPLFLEAEELVAPIDFRSIFGNDNPVEIEVGSGKALFLRNAARQCPEHNFLGIEIVRKYAFHGADRVKNLGLTNVRILPGDALSFLKKVPDQTVNTLHLYFPDPWWKRKHHKRRVFTTEFVKDVLRVLKTGGHFLIVTDVAEYFEHVGLIMSEFPQYERLADPEEHQPEHDLDYLTNFERKFRKEGRPIYRISFCKK